MSVFIRPDTKDGTYSYNFKFRGDRFSGNTGKTRKRDAEEVEERKREEARRDFEANRAINTPDAQMTIGEACTRFWNDKHLDIVDTGKLTWSLGWIQDHFGMHKLLIEIDDNALSVAIAARRGERNLNIKRSVVLVSRTTVNRTLIEPLKALLTRAKKVWKVPVKTIEWSEHFLAEPQEIVREASTGEEEAIFEHLKRGYDAAVYFAFRVGARREEILNLQPAHIDWFTNHVTLDGKGSKKRRVPMPADVRALLWGMKGQHPTKVFTYEAAYTRKAGKHSPATVAGERYPLTESGIEEQFALALKKAGVTNFRFHDTRHTAATQLLRATGNLRLVQKLLGHSDIKTTLKYAHVTDDDLAVGMARTQSHREELVAKSYTESYTDAGEKSANA